MQPIYAFAFIFVVFVIGDWVSVRTKSLVSSLFTISAIFLVAFWMGLPTTIFEDSTLLAFGSMMIPILLVHIGTMMNIQQLKEQWRTVLIALGAIIGIVIAVIGIGSSIVGTAEAFVASAPIAGGVIAGIQMGEAAAEIRRPELSLLASLIVVVQGFIGYPVASFALTKEAKRILGLKETFKNQESNQADDSDVRFTVPKKYRSMDYYLAKAALVAVAAVFVSEMIQSLVGFNLLDKNILALLFGVAAHQIGFLESKPLNLSNSYGISMAALTVVIISSLSQATPEILLELLPVLATTLILGAIGIIIMSAIVGRLLKESPWMAIAIGVSALFGFPGTYIVSNEVAQAASDNEEEQQRILSVIQPKMIVAGFITVSIASVVLAGILAPILVNL
ncbi:hypothetical protein HZY86_05055 [Aerococcaceae bacterium DSM 111020]|nr:hypothetical protein [Aerococcaceae bacterium DSM 111020]